METRQRVEQVVPLGTYKSLKRIVEGDGIAWLAARPELLGWPRDVVWILAPANKIRPWPADLVGINEAGTLVLVEAKAVGGKLPARCDPFEDTVGYEHERSFSRRTCADRLEKEWQKMFAKEANRRERYGLKTGGKLQLPGVLPYGNHRAMWSRWPDLYAEVDAFLFDQTEQWGLSYSTRVLEYLKRRRERKIIAVRYVGFVVVSTSRPPRRLAELSLKDHPTAKDVLSAKGRAHLKQLVNEVGSDAVSLRVAKGWHQGSTVRVVSRKVDLE